MKSIIMILSASMIMGFAQTAQAQACAQLWNDTCFGMSIPEVLKAVPRSAQKAAKSGDHLASGAENLVDGPVQRIAEESFTPQFYFAAGHLEQVTLDLVDVKEEYRAQSTFDTLATALRAKYGSEISSKEPSPGLLYLRSKEWMHNGTNITLFLLYVQGANDPTLHVVYQRRVSKDAGKL